MKRFNVLLPAILYDSETDVSYGTINNEKWKFHIIDIVSYSWSANDCRDSLIDHDWYNSYIVCVEVE